LKLQRNLPPLLVEKDDAWKGKGGKKKKKKKRGGKGRRTRSPAGSLLIRAASPRRAQRAALPEGGGKEGGKGGNPHYQDIATPSLLNSFYELVTSGPISFRKGKGGGRGGGRRGSLSQVAHGGSASPLSPIPCSSERPGEKVGGEKKEGEREKKGEESFSCFEELHSSDPVMSLCRGSDVEQSGKGREKEKSLSRWLPLPKAPLLSRGPHHKKKKKKREGKKMTAAPCTPSVISHLFAFLQITSQAVLQGGGKKGRKKGGKGE